MSGPADRVGVVVVSHSRALAEAAVTLAMQMVGDPPPAVAVAAGTADGGTGTDATAVLAAVQQVGGPAGVLVIMDLGSAVLSAELALELGGDLGFEVRLSPAPFLEGVVAAVLQAGLGARLGEVAGEAEAAGQVKSVHLAPVPDVGLDPGLDPGQPGPRPGGVVADVTVVNPHGLHARPAAAVVALARRYDVGLRLSDVTTGRGPVAARSMVAVQTLGAVRGHVLRVEAAGPAARTAVDELLALVVDGFGEPDGSGAGSATGTGDRTDAPDLTLTSRPTGADPEGPGAPGAPGAHETPRDEQPPTVLRGAPGAAGLGLGEVWHPVVEEPPVSTTEPGGTPAEERRRLDEAVAAVTSEVRRAQDAAPPEHRGIFQAHLLLLEDESLLGGARAGAVAGLGAVAAWQGAVDHVVGAFEALEDGYQAARAADVRSVGTQVRRRLQGAPAGLRARPGVLVVAELAPDDVRALDPAVVQAVVTAGGSATSHAAILARAAGLPLVVSAGPEVLALAEGTVLAVDGGTGELVVEPDAALRRRWAGLTSERERGRSAAAARSAHPAITRDGLLVQVAANASSADDAAAARSAGADGVGLLRTELVFASSAQAPSEDEQVAVYTTAARALAGGRLVIRTLDIGGDKPVPWAQQPVEDNPFLGLRGLRLSLAHPRLLSTQLRAVVRTSLVAPVGVMFPMVTTVDELRRARAALLVAAGQVGVHDGLPPGLEVGVMIEVPAAALRTPHLAPLVDFLSIGTNDLTQYALAAERGNAHVAGLVDALDPAVLALVAAVCRGAGDRVRVAVCGELAADPLAAEVLVGLGVRELSVSPRAVPEVKDRVRAMDAGRAADLARRCLDLPGAAEVRELLAGPPG